MLYLLAFRITSANYFREVQRWQYAQLNDFLEFKSFSADTSRNVNHKMFYLYHTYSITDSVDYIPTSTSTSSNIAKL